MNHIETNEITTPLPLKINGESFSCGRWKARMTDPGHEPYFGMGFRQDIARSESETETEITLTFRGEDSNKIRAVLQALISGQNDCSWNWSGSGWNRFRRVKLRSLRKNTQPVNK